MSKSKANSTIVDIARLANVTNITVSCAFNKPELVKPETREKIHAIAKQLNYIPNAFAQGLKNSSSQIIGIVTSSLYSPFYSTLIMTVSRIARQQGYQIMLFDTDGSEQSELQAIQALFSYQARGILLSPVRDDKAYQPSYITAAKAHRIPLILIDRDLYQQKISGVFLNNRELAQLAGNFLAQESEQNVLIIAGPVDSQITQMRLTGIVTPLRQQSKTVDIIYGDYDFISQENRVREYLTASAPRPDYIVGLNGVITLGAIAICHQLAIYSQIKFFSIDEPPNASAYGVRVAGIYHDTQKLGEMAAQLLFDAIKQPYNEKKPQRKFVSGSLLVYQDETPSSRNLRLK